MFVPVKPSSPVERVKGEPEPTKVEHLSVSPLMAKLLALLSNIRFVWKSLIGVNTLAYYVNSIITDGIGPSQDCNRLARLYLTNLIVFLDFDQLDILGIIFNL